MYGAFSCGPKGHCIKQQDPQPLLFYSAQQHQQQQEQHTYPGNGTGRHSTRRASA